ncbi:TlpA disulfide reductase family protein [Pontibacter sp. SGAir0037]|uniref:TlpA disulfide reductase family protein n=1 Tax=Pontibacter sp. SGAir0037 TaxID=2571030 RepID=UPI0010CD6C11|nr:TlpA disulfide reductase family protein [Pontibacter sp. SGAir0037]QCR22890.1 TlpA family protein disulfide reductase [Pontibacter sp. SGAir0037]
MKHIHVNTGVRAFLFLSFAIVLLISACTSTTSSENAIKHGSWRVVLHAQGQEIPFILEAADSAGKQVLYLLNAEERILLNDVTQQNDSVKIGLHIFDADLIAKADGDKMAGRFVKNDTPEPYSIPFTAEHGKKMRFSESPAAASYDYSGKWEVMFTDAEGATTEAVGIFEQKKNYVTGTFLTTTGDYRYLEGEVSGNNLKVSTFDGNHAWLFTASAVSADSIQGEFISGLTGHETWKARRNEDAALANADSLTFLKEGYESLTFSFPDLEGKQVSLQDPKYKGKVVLVQLLGSWCPNCMDETAFLAPYYKQNHNKGLEIIGLGFERSPEFEKAAARLQKMKSRFDIQYDLLVAGIADKEAASQALPALNRVMSFPTTIFIDRQGKVRKIHTGFSGPGTGKYYEEWVADFNATMQQLLAES